MDASQDGMAAPKFIAVILTILLVVGFGWYSYTAYQRHYWDDRVRELCAKDGGAHIFEEVSLPATAYQSLVNAFGELSPPEVGSSRGETSIGRMNVETHLHMGDPQVVRYEQRLVRQSDGKVLGSHVTYARVGGDFGFVDNPSTFSCPRLASAWYQKVIRKQAE